MANGANGDTRRDSQLDEWWMMMFIPTQSIIIANCTFAAKEFNLVTRTHARTDDIT